jgi:sortase A
MAVGRVLLVAGILTLLFIPYLLWGTGLSTSNRQAELRKQFGSEQHGSGLSPANLVSAPKVGAPGGPPQVAPVIADPAVGSPVGVIAIPKIGLSMVMVEGIDEAQLRMGPAHYPGTPLPGEAGNAAIAGHRTTYLHPFYSVDALVPGDNIVVTTLQGIFLYKVSSSEVVAPSDVAVVGPTSTPQLTLTTCNPRYSAAQRLIVHAVLAASSLVHPKSVLTSTTPTAPQPGRHQPVPTAPAKNWTATIVWGAVVAALTTAVWMATSRTRRWRRALISSGGTLAWLVVVFYFFQSVSPLFGGSF